MSEEDKYIVSDYQLINNELVKLTVEEKTARQKYVDDARAQTVKRKEIQTQKATDAKNGNKKLLDLGLTQAEATAITGYTPPEE